MEENLFHGKLVRLAAPSQEDAAILARWSHDAGYLRALDTDYAWPRAPEAFTSEDSPGTHAIEFRLRTLEDDRLVGIAALHSIEWNNRAGELSIGIGEAAYRGKGYGSDALRLILRYAFNELNLERVGLDVISNNAAALRTYERAGFRHEGARRLAVLRDGQRYDLILMGILREEWLEHASAGATARSADAHRAPGTDPPG